MLITSYPKNGQISSRGDYVFLVSSHFNCLHREFVAIVVAILGFRVLLMSFWNHYLKLQEIHVFDDAVVIHLAVNICVVPFSFDASLKSPFIIMLLRGM